MSEKSTEQIITEITEILDSAEGYEGTANATLEATLAMFEHAASRLGLTGFQASWVLLQVLWKGNRWKGPGIVLQAHDNLYPQYPLPVVKVSEWFGSDEVQDYLRDEARKMLAENRYHVSPTVLKHWQTLAREDDE